MKSLFCTIKPATARLPKRVHVQGETISTDNEWELDLTDEANIRLAANRALCELNSEPHNAVNRIRYHILAGAFSPDGKVFVYIIGD